MGPSSDLRSQMEGAEPSDSHRSGSIQDHLSSATPEGQATF